ncbi:MAG: 4Fe-4S ferredoxin [Bdellovibrio sp.]|nr:MAG: 4Fe-4S ferredoxin [Bdellovibrio sp.]
MPISHPTMAYSTRGSFAAHALRNLDLLEFLLNHTVLVGLVLVGFFTFRRMVKSGRQTAHAKKMIEKAIRTQTHEPISLHPDIDPALCAGCGNCTKVCPEGDILQMIHRKAVLVNPAKCVGHGECEIACPTDAISLVFGTKTRGMDIPHLSSNYETNVPGLYIAGELGGMGLIRNAIKQGALAAGHALANLADEKAQFDLLIVGAGPAGLAASLSAIAAKKSYLCVEQNSFGGTVANFPRQKVVMSQPFSLPIVGTKKFPSNKFSKEELIAYWEDTRKKTGLKIKEKTGFKALKRVGKIFEVETSQGTVTAKKVILAMGVRGSPRRLGVPGESLSKVTFNLIDPEQYQGQHVVVVGGGNAGVEAAQMLGAAKWKNKVHLLVRSQSFDRCNEDNEKTIRAMEKQGLVTIWFESQVSEIRETSIVIKRKEEVTELLNHFVFIFAGAEMPHKFLMSLGVQIDKKFGEGLSKAA